MGSGIGSSTTGGIGASRVNAIAEAPTSSVAERTGAGGTGVLTATAVVATGRGGRMTMTFG